MKKLDLFVSEGLVALAPVCGGFALVLATRFSLALLPGVLVACLFFGLGCVGVKRLWNHFAGQRQDVETRGS